MSRFKRILSILSAVTMLGALAGPAAGIGGLAPIPDRLEGICAVGPVDQVAGELLGAATELVRTDDGTALALTPGIYPGIRHRLVQATEGTWCPSDALNLVTDLTAGPLALASMAATVLPAAHFDQVTILDATQTAPDVIELTTHARTNGVVADWTVRVDALGVSQATWTATDFAVTPFDPQWEGLTALPGATMTYARDRAGLLRPTTDVMALAEAERQSDPSPFITIEASDGFTMHVVVGDATFYPGAANTIAGTNLPTVYGGVAPDPGTDTGDAQVDYLRIMGEGLDRTYEAFLEWGMEKGWQDDEGALYVDGALSFYCLACVLVSEYFNIHMNRAAHEAIAVLGYRYPDARDALINIVGHELLHNFQNAYGKPDSTGGGRNNSYSEGMARMSETMHDFSAVSHQPESLVYADDINGCNGWAGNNMDAQFAAGPLTGRSYNACYFWMTFHAMYGVDAFVAVMEQSEGLPTGRPWQIYGEAIRSAIAEVAPDSSLEEALANFAAMAITGRDYRWGVPQDPDAPHLDWAEHLRLWWPNPTIRAGQVADASLRDGGIVAFELLGDAVVGTISDDEGHAAAVVIDHGDATDLRMLDEGDEIVVPTGSSAWLLILNSSTSSSLVEVALEAIE